MFITSDGNKFEDFLDAYNHIELLVNDYHYEIIKTTEDLEWLHSSCGDEIIITQSGSDVSKLAGKNLITWALKRKYPPRQAVLGIFELDDVFNKLKFTFYLDLFNFIEIKGLDRGMLTPEENLKRLDAKMTSEQEKILYDFRTEIDDKIRVGAIK